MSLAQRLRAADDEQRSAPVIGKAAGIPGNLIDANGPIEVDGSAIASHAPVQRPRAGKDLPGPATYKLSLVQNPSLPTVDVYAQAPTTAQAIALANGAVTGFAKFVNQLDRRTFRRAQAYRGPPAGRSDRGVVDSGASKKSRSSSSSRSRDLVWRGPVRRAAASEPSRGERLSTTKIRSASPITRLRLTVRIVLTPARRRTGSAQ